MTQAEKFATVQTTISSFVETDYCGDDSSALFCLRNAMVMHERGDVFAAMRWLLRCVEHRDGVFSQEWQELSDLWSNKLETA